MADDTLFSSSHAALVFAFNFSMQAYDRPMLNRLAAPGSGGGNGLAGLDGAAQAGIIRHEVKAIANGKKLLEAIVVAKFAPMNIRCDCKSQCCSGQKLNAEWANSIGYISDDVRNTALAGCSSTALLRREYVSRYFMPKHDRKSIERIAVEYDINRDTVSAHMSKVQGYLGGKRSGEKGLEAIIMEMIEDRFREMQIVA
jgi:hypothetical protein